ncbi:MAG: WhiB family transcriptional regulator [Actinomycetota bacterium]
MNGPCGPQAPTWEERPSGRDVVIDGWTSGWQLRAACRGEDSSFFYAPSYFEKRREKDAREAVAKAICRTCPVLDECREYSLEVREGHGIWGGLNEMERRALLRQRAAQAV